MKAKRFFSILLSVVMLISLASINVAFAADNCVVAGTEGLTGENWNSGSTANVMTLNADGLYEKVYTNVAPGTNHEFKIVYNNGWYGNEWGNNIRFSVPFACDVTITFDPESKKVSYNADIKLPDLRVVGNGKGNWLYGENWSLSSELNLMPEISENVYEITYEDVAKGSYEFKFTSAASWNYAFCGANAGNGIENDAYYGGGDNIKFYADYDLSDVTIKLDLSNFVYSSGSGAKFTITVTEAVEEPVEVVEITSFDGTTAKVLLNLDEITDELNLRVAIYNGDDAMLQVMTMDITSYDGSELEFPFTNTSGSSYAKAFLWYDGTVTPVCNAGEKSK